MCVFQAQSADASSSNLMRVPGEIPRRSKSNPGHFNLMNMNMSLSTTHMSGQSSAPHSAVLASTVTKIQPPVQTTTKESPSMLASSLPTQSSTGMTAPPSASHELSPNLPHKVTTSSAQHTAKKPPLASHISVPAPQPQHLDGPRQRMLDRANKARLYFLRQSGPNKFLIGGDSYDSRFHVNIGPQVRSCLFVGMCAANSNGY